MQPREWNELVWEEKPSQTKTCFRCLIPKLYPKFMSNLRNEPKLNLLTLRNLKPKHLNRINKPNCHSSIYQKKDSERERKVRHLKVRTSYSYDHPSHPSYIPENPRINLSNLIKQTSFANHQQAHACIHRYQMKVVLVMIS